MVGKSYRISVGQSMGYIYICDNSSDKLCDICDITGFPTGTKTSGKLTVCY